MKTAVLIMVQEWAARPVRSEVHRTLLRGSHLSILLNKHFEGDGTLVFGAACQFGCEGVLFWRAYGALS